MTTSLTPRSTGLNSDEVNFLTHHYQQKGYGMRKYLSEAVKRFQRLTEILVANACMPYVHRLFGEISVQLTLYLPDKRVKDVDNYPKWMLDLLIKLSIWEDDTQVKSM